MLGTPVSLLVGIILLLGAVILFFLDKLRPAVARDSDKVYAVFILMAGLLALAIQEITLGESFQMILMAGMLTTVYIENVGNREPKEVVPGPPAGARPPRPPRYDGPPPVRRGYRAELDDRRDMRPEFDRRPVQPRMNPAQAPYPQGAWANDQVRPPYEENRGPAGRLQPSRPGNAGGPPDNRYTDNDRYGARPPVPQGPPQRGPERGPADPNNRPAPAFQGEPEDRSGARPPSRPSTEGYRPEGYRSEEPREDRSAANNSLNNGSDNSLRNDAENGSGNGSSGRALNVRPLSEAPKFDDDYRPEGNPEGAPSY